MANLAAEQIDLGPSKVANEGKAFVLPHPEWLGIQTFVSTAQQLPTTKATMDATLPAKPSGTDALFTKLLTAYKALKTSCDQFEKITLPDSVTCASNVVTYNNKVQTYYPALIKELEKYNENAVTPAEIAANELIMKRFAAVCDLLIRDAAKHQEHAQKVYDALKSFSAETLVSRLDIVNLHLEFSSVFDTEEGVIAKLEKRIKFIKDLIDELQKEYEHDVIVAATSATYAFMPPFGTIAAAIVMGVYTDKAIKIKAQIEGYEEEAEKLKGTLAADRIVSATLASVKQDLVNLQSKIDAALPGIGKIQGLWFSMEHSLREVKTILKDNVQDMPAFMAALGLENAQAEWKTASVAAAKYTEIAFIKVIPASNTKKMTKAADEFMYQLKVVHLAK